jgi:hypothetical protein
MNFAEIRRARLREWLRTHSTPPKEKSYFSQLVNATASFGEKAARRIERQYGMDDGYLDRPMEGMGEGLSREVSPARSSMPGQLNESPSAAIQRLLAQLTETQKAEIAHTMQAMADKNERLLAELLARRPEPTGSKK